MANRDFLTLLDSSPEELEEIVARARELKRLQRDHKLHQSLSGRTLAMIFQQNSTRTRLGFEAGMTQLGGHAVFLSPSDTQLGRGEPISDTARVLSEMVDAVVIRTPSHEDLITFTEAASVPVINAMTSRFHPCQLLADMQTFAELRGPIAGRAVAFVGDGYNMCHSYINAARQFDFRLNIACPEGYDPNPKILEPAAGQCRIIRDPMEAAKGVDLVVTDVWASMGQESEQAKRERAFSGYQVDDKLMRRADRNALFMHCLPAHRGEEVSASVIDGPQSVVWSEAENRMHAQKALLELLLSS